MKEITIGIIFWFGVCQGCFAQAYIIFDNKNTVDIRSYYQSLSLSGIEKPDQLLTTKYPVTTPNMSPGLVEYQDAYFPKLGNPLCLVGDDDFSFQWMTKFKSDLVKNNVSCWMVNAANRNEFVRMRNVADGITLHLGNAEDVADYFGVRHYPVLIDARYIAQ